MSKYRLGDYTVQNWNNWDRAPRDPGTVASIATWISGGAAAGTLAYAVAYGAVYIGISFVTSWALSALMPKPDFGALGSSGLLVNSLDAASPQDFVYGKVRKGGSVTFYESTGEENKYLHQMIVLAAHEVEAIDSIYINDEIVTLDSDGFVTDDLWQSKIRILYHLGDQTSTADEFANAAGKNLSNTLLEESELTDGDALDSNFVGKGLAYLYVRYEYNQDVFANGLPLITAVIRGKKVYDPRSGTTGYSDNAALCIRDFITSNYGLRDNAIDDVVFAAAANECDENVALSGGGTEKRYTINGVVRADRSIGDVLQSMTTACAGTLFWGSGYWKLKVGVYSPPVKTLTLDDLRSSISLDTRVSMRDNFNTVRGTFIDANQDWITADYPAIESEVFVAEDGGDELPLDLALPYTTSSATAQRLAKMTLFRGREQMTISAEFGLNAFDVEVGDIIAFTNDRYGFDEKEFEVIGWRFAANQDAGDLRVSLTLRETSEAAFDWDAEESDIIGNDTNLPNPSAALAINNLTASGGGRTQGDGTFINSVILDWDTVTNAFIDFYEVEWKALTDSSYNSTTTKQSDIEISPLVDGILYVFRVRAVTVSGINGPYSSVQFTGGGDDTAPGLPTSISATGGFRYITISWTNPADADLNYVEIYENTTNTTFGANRVGISGGDSFTRTNLGLEETRYYFLKSVDYSGNASDFTSGVSATTTYLDDPDFENGIRQLFIDQGLDIIEPVASLPPAGDFVGQQVFLTTDGKLYSWSGSTWEAVVADVAAGSITATEIADNAISTPKLQANAVVADKIAGSTITGDKIVANTITGGLLATSGIITNTAQINDALITNAKIQNAAVETLTIAGEAVTAPRFAFVDLNGYLFTSYGTYEDVLSVTTTNYGFQTYISFTCSCDSVSDITAFRFKLYRNGVEITSFDQGAGLRDSASMVFVDTDTTPGARTYTMKATLIIAQQGRLYQTGLHCIQYKR